jgi:hypothetical protein
MPIRTTIVDDQDAQFVYEGNWTTHASVQEYGQTSHLTRCTGCTVTLKFRGTSIAVYGTVIAPQESQGLSVPPISKYSLEDGSSVEYSAHPGAQDQYRGLFFKRDNLPMGDHVLIVQNLVQDDFFLLDYVEVGSNYKSRPIGTVAGAIVASVLGTLLLSCDSLSVADNQTNVPHIHDGQVTAYNLGHQPLESSAWLRIGGQNPHLISKARPCNLPTEGILSTADTQLPRSESRPHRTRCDHASVTSGNCLACPPAYNDAP